MYTDPLNFIKEPQNHYTESPTPLKNGKSALDLFNLATEYGMFLAMPIDNLCKLHHHYNSTEKYDIQL